MRPHTTLRADGGRPAPEPGADLSGWEVTRDTSDPLAVGDSLRFSKPLTEADVAAFARASGDTNPLHLDEAFAERTRFDGRVVHGVLVAGVVSAAVARLAEGVIYVSQDLAFRAPVHVGDRVTATIEVVEALGDDRYRLRTTVDDGETTVVDGEAVVLVDEIGD